MASVTLQKLSKLYGDVTAVDALDLKIADGEFLTLLGPSGCGKSTALACVAGLERPSHGAIVFDDRDVTDLEPHQRNVAMVFQDYALYPHMTVTQNMSFGLKQQRIDAATIDRQVAAAADLLVSARCSSAGRRSSAAGSASASPSAAPWCATRPSSCSTSRCPTSTRRCASAPAPRSSGCSASSASPRSSSPTTRKRRWCSPTASPSSATASCSRSARRWKSIASRTTCSSPRSSARRR